MTCALKFADLNDRMRIATCTHPDHRWAISAPGHGLAKAQIEHRRHTRTVTGQDEGR